MWYLDDGSLGGTPMSVLEDFKTIISLSEEIGLELNLAKCEIAILGTNDPATMKSIYDDFELVAPNITHISDDNAFLLGAPLNAASIVKCLRDKIINLQIFAERIDYISSHCAYFLLKNSLAIPRLVYFLRCCPTWKHMDLLEEFDQILKLTMEKVANNSFNDDAWKQISLPVRLGGLGVRHAVNLAFSSFLASVYSVEDLVNRVLPDEVLSIADSNTAEALNNWIEINSDCVPPKDEYRCFQSYWESASNERIRKNLKERSTNQFDTARLIAAEDKDAGAWLNALPSRQLGTHLDDACFRIAIGLRLGTKICQSHKCKCGVDVDEFGRHGLSCKKSTGRNYRHSSVNDIIKRALVSAGIPSILEPVGCARDDGKRPDGMTLVPWSAGKCLLWDFTCVDTFAASYINETSIQLSAAANLAERKKTLRYRDLEENYIFVPVGIETAGSWGKHARSLIRTIGRRIASATEEPKSTSYLIQRISIAVQRGNTASILGTLPCTHGMDEVFYLL